MAYVVIRQQTGAPQKIGCGHSVHFFERQRAAESWALARAQKTGCAYMVGRIVSTVLVGRPRGRGHG